jgi:hypothetical protein
MNRTSCVIQFAAIAAAAASLWSSPITAKEPQNNQKKCMKK